MPSSDSSAPSCSSRTTSWLYSAPATSLWKASHRSAMILCRAAQRGRLTDSTPVRKRCASAGTYTTKWDTIRRHRDRPCRGACGWWQASSSGTRPASTLSARYCAKARGAGVAYRRSGGSVPTSTTHTILRNRLYTGWFDWKGQVYPGRHEPLASVELWERVQAVLDGRSAKKHRCATHDFAFSGLIACSKCGCSIVGEIMKQRYVYYRCSGYAGKCRDEPASCRQKRVREERLEEQFAALLGRLQFDDEVRAWVCGRGCAPAMPMSGRSTKRPSKGCRRTTSGWMTGYTPRTSTSLMARSAASSTTVCGRVAARAVPPAARDRPAPGRGRVVHG
jgi:hypothetical protein